MLARYRAHAKRRQTNDGRGVEKSLRICYILDMLNLFRAAALALLALLASPALAEGPDGQSRADYHAWLAREPAARAQVMSFRQFLDMDGVGDVIPTWQLLRTASSWRDCSGPRFEVAPVAEWGHIAQTLKFVSTHVEPAIGDVEAVSGYRNGELNTCSGGAPASAHRHFFALDLTPVAAVGRETMIGSLCRIHDDRGRLFDVGLGFYTGVRFHVDSKGFRRWGSNGSSATSPCNTGVYA